MFSQFIKFNHCHNNVFVSSMQQENTCYTVFQFNKKIHQINKGWISDQGVFMYAAQLADSKILLFVCYICSYVVKYTLTIPDKKSIDLVQLVQVAIQQLLVSCLAAQSRTPVPYQRGIIQQQVNQSGIVDFLQEIADPILFTKGWPITDLQVYELCTSRSCPYR